MLHGLFCKHEWEILKERFIESNLERLHKRGIRGRFQHTVMDIQATHIVIATCSKCGKIKKFETRT